MMRRWRTLGLVAALLGGLGTAVAAERKVDAVYDIYLGGIWLADMRIEAEIGRIGYRARANLKTKGLVKAFYKAGFSAQTTGKARGIGLIPDRFAADSYDSRKRQAVEIIYGFGTPTRLVADPPFKPKPWEVDPLAQTGAADPLTAALSALAPEPGVAPCGRKVAVFDGRKRYAVKLGKPEARRGMLKCEAEYRRVAGFKPKQMKKPGFPFALWFRENGDGGYEFLRAMGETPLGTAVIRLRVAR